MRQIIADVGYYETRAAVLENERLAEIHFERLQSSSLVNNIYMARIINLLPGLRTAFLDIGISQNVFLYQDQMTIPFETLRPGEMLMVQVVKDAYNEKGPKATMHLSLPGKYLVMLPETAHIGISNKIVGKEKRDQLHQWATTLKKDNHGLIIRTVSIHQTLETLEQDWRYLQSLWNLILHRKNTVPHGRPLYREQALLPRLLRDLVNTETELFLLNNSQEADLLRNICNQLMPQKTHIIETADVGTALFQDFQVEPQWERAMQPRVPLPSGGYVVIHHTEALTSIDVNTGRFKGKGGFQESVRLTNLEAADEIARQLRLRDIGGIIIIDFIDLKSPVHQNELLKYFQDVLGTDRQKTTLLGFTRLGLVEMTRKRTRQKMTTLFNDPCECCLGSGTTRSIYWSLYEIETILRRLSNQTDLAAAVVIIHPARLSQMEASGINLTDMAKEYGIHITIKTKKEYALDQLEVSGIHY